MHACGQHHVPDHEVECPERNAVQLGRRRIDDERRKDSLRKAHMEDHSPAPIMSNRADSPCRNAEIEEDCLRNAFAQCGIVTGLVGIAAKKVAVRI
jgi:hypothetical protein